ncbi:hypothetical protein N8083_01035 [Candidatus Pacebacteria bacterium]|nr:hypothetical protein [Candidatus Paceibacterota bacterium]
MEYIESLFTTILPLHIGAVLVSLGIIFCSDIYGALWVFGKIDTLNRKIIAWFHTIAWAGLIIISITGVLLFLPYSQSLLSEFAFRLKILFLMFITINGLVIGRHMNIASIHSFASLSWRKRILLLVSGTVSITGWIGSYIAAHFV